MFQPFAGREICSCEGGLEIEGELISIPYGRIVTRFHTERADATFIKVGEERFLESILRIWGKTVYYSEEPERQRLINDARSKALKPSLLQQPRQLPNDGIYS